MNQRGKLVVIVMFVTAFAMGGYAWWHQYRGGRRCAEFWGTKTMVAVRYAPQTEYLALSPIEKPTPQDAPTSAAVESAKKSAADQHLSVVIDGQEFVSQTPNNISQAPGLVHARHVLVDDSSFLWDQPADGCSPQWEFALRFSDNGEQVTVAFDTHCGWVTWVEGNRRTKLIAGLTEAFRKKQSAWKVIRSPH